MDNSKYHPSFSEFLGFHGGNYANSRTFLIHMMKNSLLFGADKVLMSRRSKPFFGQENEVVRRKFDDDDDDDQIFLNEEFVDGSKVVNFPSMGYNEFPFNFLAFWAILVLKFVGYQINLLTTFLTLPIWLSYSTLMFFLFPLQTLSTIKSHLTKKFLTILGGFYLSIASFIFSKIKAQKKVLNLGKKLVWAFSCSIYVFFVLVGLLVSGFLLGGLIVRRLVEQPVQMTERVNFDYTKASPVAFVPVFPSPGAGVSSGLVSRESVEVVESGRVRAIPCNHKLQLTVSLTLPESEYNKKLGIFQVRVDFLSATGKLTASSTHPCMLRFKSHRIQLIETAFKTVPIITGFQSEAQTLTIRVSDFTEGHEPTACLKVVIERRAEYQQGAGIPQIYDAMLSLESELPSFKKVLWCWRRSVLVWISFVVFLVELVVVLVLLKPVFMPRGKVKGVGGDKGSFYKNKISWCKSI